MSNKIITEFYPEGDIICSCPECYSEIDLKLNDLLETGMAYCSECQQHFKLKGKLGSTIGDLKQTCTKERAAIACRITKNSNKKENYALIYVNLDAPDEEIMKSLIVASSKIVEVKSNE